MVCVWVIISVRMHISALFDLMQHNYGGENYGLFVVDQMVLVLVGISGRNTDRIPFLP